jgi:hypothetical protein
MLIRVATDFLPLKISNSHIIDNIANMRHSRAVRHIVERVDQLVVARVGLVL